MFAFLGELIEFVVWLIEQGCVCLERAVGTSASLNVRTGLLPGIRLRHSSWPASAANRLAVGPPLEDWLARLCGEPWSVQLVTVSIPLRHQIRD